MPTYEYECEPCDTGRIDVVRTVSDTSDELCPDCSQPMRRLVSMFSPSVPMKELSAMTPNEIGLHRAHARDIEKQAAAGNLASLKVGKKTPRELMPNIPKTVF